MISWPATRRTLPQVLPSNAAWGWGTSQFGQLGPGAGSGLVESPLPVRIPYGTSALAAGADMTVALSGGRIYTWGRGDHGQLGDGTTTRRSTPVAIAMPQPVNVVAAHRHHVLAVARNGQLFGWGGNDRGQLGDGTSIDRYHPVAINVPGVVRTVAAGAAFSAAVTADGVLWMWGAGTSGQLGTGSRAGVLSPTRVALPKGVRIAQVAAGVLHTLAVTTSGQVYAWGSGSRGQLGSSQPESSRPVLVPLGARAVACAAGTNHSVVLTSDGRVWTFGADDLGQCSGVPGPDRSTAVRITLPGNAKVSKLALHHNRTIALTTDNRVIAWGATPFTTHNNPKPSATVTAPRVVALPDSLRALDVATGAEFALALVDAGTASRIVSLDRRPSTRIGQPITLRARAIDAGGSIIDRTITATSPAGRFSGLTFTPARAGLADITLRCDSATTRVRVVVR